MSRTSPYKRALAARMIREGKSYTETGRAIGRDRRTITRWMRDESFLNMLHAHGVLSAGPLRVRAAVDDVLHDLPTEESWLWLSVPDATVLGSLVVDDATHLRVAFIPPERVPFVRAELEQKRFPVLAGERTTVLVPDALEALQDQEALELLVRICSADPAEAFRAFLSVWRFRAQETMDIRTLGAELWPAQELFTGCFYRSKRSISRARAGEAFIAEVEEDEPESAELLRVEAVEFGEETYPGSVVDGFALRAV